MTRLPTLPRLLADLAACLRFFSRLPVPRLSSLDEPATAPDFRRAAAMVPPAGLVVALPAALGAAVAAWIGLPALVTGGLAIGLMALTTGALHEDGLADSADGLFGGMDRDRRLAIMRDSRIGSYGALALVTTVLVRAGAIGALAAAGPAVLAASILSAATVSRAVMVAMWWHLPPARPDGLSAAAGRPGGGATSVALALGLAGALIAGPAAGWTATGIGLALAAAAGFGVARAARTRIGGQTGDVLGAVQQLAEAAFLVALSA